MPILSVGKQTDSEYHEYFKDILRCTIKKVFNKNDRMLFVTYQPIELTLDSKEVAEQTNRMLNEFKYIEVLEQTYSVRRIYNDSGYIDGYHSHILIKESDFDTVKSKLQGFDIVEKVVYDIERLTERYLSKQAGMSYIRILPTCNIPITKPLPNDTITVSVFKKALRNPFSVIVINIALHYNYISCLI